MTRVRVQNVKIGGCVGVTAADAVVEDSHLIGCKEEAVNVNADRATIRGNTARFCDGDCITARGDYVLVENNHLSMAEDGECIEIGGDFAVVRRNFGRSCSLVGIRVSGANPTVVKNELVGISQSAYLIDCAPCSGGEVSGNTARRINDSFAIGFDLFADAAGLLVADNRATGVARSGFDVSGTGIVLRGNEAEATGFDGSDAAYRITGTGHVLIGNRARKNYHDGFFVLGSGHLLEDNRADRNAEDGFDVHLSAVGVTLRGNRADRNGAVGVEVSSGASNTTVENNRARENAVDFCDEGTATSSSGNDFGSQSPLCYVDF